ncbi:MAG: hypothetical protein A3A88_11250 [Nitrospirae bacterium RIFCSPLOWO2_01_FULL_62_17]|nr:MAG: hypothetical protein A3A88_11250 [Nitrospirae bacterium RIFCSPLOWO2_01_FULL_62_17]
MEIEPEKSDQAAGERGQHHGNHHILIDHRHDEEPEARHQADAARQPVHHVDDIDRVDDADHPEHGERNGQPIRQGGDLDPDTAANQHEHRDQLPDQLGPRFQHPEIVDEADHDHECAGQHQPQDLLPELEGQGQADKKRQVHREPSEIGHRLGLKLQPPIRTIHDIERERRLARHRHAIQRQEQRQHKGQCQDKDAHDKCASAPRTGRTRSA